MNRTYNDVAHALTRYPSLAPRTDVHSTTSPRSWNEIAREQNTDSSSSFFQRNQCVAAASIGHNPRQLPRQHVQIPPIDMGAACLPTKASFDLCHADGKHDDSPRTTH